MSEPEQPAAPASAEGAASAAAPVSAEDAAASNASNDEDSELLIDEFGPPFIPKTFGGAFVWAKGEGFVTTVLRVKAGKSVPVATANRRDMHVMLTGGRAVLEVDDGEEVDRVELVPAAPLKIDPDNRYRLIAMTEVEIFTVYTQD